MTEFGVEKERTKVKKDRTKDMRVLIDWVG
jgi:hypothetical protein